MELTSKDYDRLAAAREKRRRKLERYTNTTEAAANRAKFATEFIESPPIPLLSPEANEDIQNY